MRIIAHGDKCKNATLAINHYGTETINSITNMLCTHLLLRLKLASRETLFLTFFI